MSSPWEYRAMLQCPDCDSIKDFPGINEGDGVCSVCHGTGELGSRSLMTDGPCENCWGSSECPTCGGVGVIDD